MSKLFPSIDPQGLLEYSVVYNDRSVNHMSVVFQNAMRQVSTDLRDIYAADALVIIPGGGTFAMEAVARQFAADKRCLCLRNGWFNYRWTQIFEMGAITTNHRVLKARPVHSGSEAAFMPAPLSEVIATIHAEKPELVFATHVETSAGLILSDEYLSELAHATHAVGGLLVLDCVASGAVFVDMRRVGVDILLTAPQKGWSASPGFGLILLGAAARDQLVASQTRSFAMDLKKWLQIMQSYETGAHAYHATLPTDALMVFADVLREAKEIGLQNLSAKQWELGRRIRACLSNFPSVAAEGYQAPGVIVCYCQDDALQSGRKFAQLGLQIAAGVPLMCGEGQDFRTFRLGLFGLEKLKHVDRTVKLFAEALAQIEG